MNAIGDATFALGLVLLIWETGTLEFFGVFDRRRLALDDDGQPRRARAARRRGREVGADPAAHLASRRDGRPDAGLGAHPRGDDGDGRRLPPRPREPDLRGGARRAAPRRDPRRDHAPRRRRRRARAVGHQARHRVLDDVADRLHVPRGRDRRVRLRDLPPDDARLLQGAAVHDGRPRHPPPRTASRTSARWAASRRSCRGRTSRSPSARSRSMGIPIFSGFWSKDGIVSAAFASGDALGYTLYVAGLVGALLTGLYTTRLYFAVFRGEPSDFVKEHAHEGHGEGPRSMTIPVGVLTVLATIGGLVVIPGVWEPFLHWIDETAEPLVTATVAEDYGTSAIAVTLGAHRLLRRAPRLRGRPPDRHEPRHLAGARAQALLRRARTTRCSTGRPRRSRSRSAGTSRSRSSSARSTRSAPARSRSAARSRACSPGLLRTYAIAIAFAVCVLVVVFVAVR